MLLKLTIKDILKQRTFAIIAIVSGLVLGIIYYLLTFEMGFSHLISDIELLAVHMSISILLTGIVAILAGINIALVAYNIKAQRSMNMKKKRCYHVFRWNTNCIYAWLPCLYHLTVSTFRDCGRSCYIPTSRVRTKVYFNFSIDFFNLVGNEKHQQGIML